MKSVDPPKKSVSMDVQNGDHHDHELSSNSHSESALHPNQIDNISDHQLHTEHEDTHLTNHTNHTDHHDHHHHIDDNIDLITGAAIAGAMLVSDPTHALSPDDPTRVEPLSDEIINNALGIKLDPNYKHRPLSPTPYSRDHTGIDDGHHFTEIQPLKTSSMSHLHMPSTHSLHGGSL
eukprot:CAMPEP_0201578716 /NCGR_PEP_ID=MMETSP0190_2-20130828/25739_1 /ASSEMBLY_ACC=CAM_ASM_000263 /TAXON_ID=37353 /ORGANISM="Rosalina sp." /LENGTH=176 /DNA_ID=CAMNT_0048012211 /DNA_START=85 /DNA_END=612 /DNA_ORIENTATION=+